MSRFDELVSRDRQLQFARNAVEKYQKEVDADIGGGLDSERMEKKESVVDGDFSSGSGLSKRHIVNVDDISKINYEIVKNTPGNLISPAFDGSKKVEDEDRVLERLENDVNQCKIKLYKNKLYAMNEEFLGSVGKTVMNEEVTSVAKGSDDDISDIPDEVQVKWLTEIQEGLIDSYEDLINKEKKWFTLKELLLEANAELDLFSTIDINKPEPNIVLGDPNAPTNPYSTINTLLFNSRKKRNLKISE